MCFATLKFKEHDSKEVARYWNYLINERFGTFDTNFDKIAEILNNGGPVSYTHLTLPTTPYV